MRHSYNLGTAASIAVNSVKLLLLVTLAITASACSMHMMHDRPGAHLAIAEQGDFYVGGKVVHSLATSSSGENDPNPGPVVINQMYVQYQIPVYRKYQLPVIMVHGSWHTGKTYGSTPDGREGWGTYFVRKGFPVYIVDDPNRGRAGYDMTAHNQVRLGTAGVKELPAISRRTNENAWITFRIGPKPGVAHPNTQFPAEAAEQYFAQLTYNYRAPEEDDKIVAGLVALLDKIGTAILLTHSQSGPFGWRAAIARPNLVKGIVAVEPVRPELFKDFKALASVPLTIIRGDFEQDKADAAPQAFADNVRAAGGNGTFVRLPKIGIRGNSHMMMMERNNLELADFIISWIEKNVNVRWF